MSVSQSLGYGNNYITTLQLGYGRRVGEILPHPFDVLGGIYIETYQNDIERSLANESVSQLGQTAQDRLGQQTASQPLEAQKRGTAVQTGTALRRFADL